VLTELCFA
jgi:hypothetical protein